MRYNELISSLKYWKSISEEENPEIVCYVDDGEINYEIYDVSPVRGIDDKTAIGIIFED